MALSPLDGRYRDSVASLDAVLSDREIARRRLQIEVEWLIWLGDLDGVQDVAPLSDSLRSVLRSWSDQLDEGEFQAILEIEKVTRHDTVAVTEYLADRLRSHGVPELAPKVHQLLTSEDVSGLAYALAFREAMDVWRRAAGELVDLLRRRAAELAVTLMPARTHGQSAVPTTMGKELSVFVSRWDGQLASLRAIEYRAKFSGAVGNYNAHILCYPEVDWRATSQAFVERFGITFNPLTTQSEPRDWLAELCHVVLRFNAVTLDFVRDMWTYVSFQYFSREPSAGEVGSSTMPQKVNPIQFENAEGNLGVSSALLGHLAEKLPVSRLQRDLSDSTVLRSFGVALGHSLVALTNARRGTADLHADEAKMRSDLDRDWSLVAEGVQAVLKAQGIVDARDRATRAARAATSASLREAWTDVPLDKKWRLALERLAPSTYSGLAAELAVHVFDTQTTSRGGATDGIQLDE